MLKAALRLLSPGGPQARLSVLIFHRVLPVPDPLFPTEIHARSFDAICGWLATWCNVLPLDEAVRRMQDRELPERALAITFDDGYADNRTHALPILLRHRLPATFFIATGYLGRGQMWNDTVIEAIRHCRFASLPLHEVEGVRLGSVPIASAAERRTAIDALIRAAMYLPQARRTALAERLSQLAGVAPSNTLMMSAAQVVELHRAGMQIGAHTVSHPILAGLSEHAACDEIERSRSFLESLLGARVGLFAYPNGRPGTDYSPSSVQLVRRLGFDAAVSTAWGSADATSDVFQLPRFTPWDRSRSRFGLRLAGNLWSSRRGNALTVPTPAASC
jgi:peptidoglycan/xylan/chitin deacetylase (PgdA/CDA1 family)